MSCCDLIPLTSLLSCHVMSCPVLSCQVAAREGDLKAQQKRLVYGQTLSSQQKQLEDALTELDHTKALLEEQEARRWVY